MEPLVLPSTGLVYLDASSLIYSVERVEPYRTLLEPMWQRAQDGNLTIVSSPVLVVEALVKPLRDGNTEIEMQYCRGQCGETARGLICGVRRCRPSASQDGFGDTRCTPRRDSSAGRLRSFRHQRH